MSAMAANQRASVSLPLDSVKRPSDRKEQASAPAWANARLSLRPVAATKDNKSEDVKGDAPKRPTSWALPHPKGLGEASAKGVVDVAKDKSSETSEEVSLASSPRQAQQIQQTMKPDDLNFPNGTADTRGTETLATIISSEAKGSIDANGTKEGTKPPPLPRKPPVPSKAKPGALLQTSVESSRQDAKQSDGFKEDSVKEDAVKLAGLEKIETATVHGTSTSPGSVASVSATSPSSNKGASPAQKNHQSPGDGNSPRGERPPSDSKALPNATTPLATAGTSPRSTGSAPKSSTGSATTPDSASKLEKSGSGRLPSGGSIVGEDSKVRSSPKGTGETLEKSDPGPLLVKSDVVIIKTSPKLEKTTSGRLPVRMEPPIPSVQRSLSEGVSSLRPALSGFPSVKERAQTFSAASKPPAAPRVVVSSMKNATTNAVASVLVVGRMPEQVDEEARKKKAQEAVEEEEEERMKRVSQREEFLRAFEQVKQEALASTSPKQNWSDEEDEKTSPSPARTPNRGGNNNVFFPSGSPSSTPVFPRPETKVHSTTPLAPFSATSKPPPTRSAFGGSETPVAAAARPAPRPPPALPSARPLSVSLGPSAVPFASSAKSQQGQQPLEDAKEGEAQRAKKGSPPAPLPPKRPLSVPRSPSKEAAQPNKKLPPPLPEVRVRSRSRSGSGSSLSRRTSKGSASPAGLKKKVPSPLVGGVARAGNRALSVDEDFDEYDGVEIFDEETGTALNNPSGRSTPPPGPPAPSGRTTPPPPPPQSSSGQQGEEDDVQMAGQDEEIDWSDFSEDSDSSEDSTSAAAISSLDKSMLHHRSTNMFHDARRDAAGELAHMLGAARLRTTTFPVSEGMIDFDTSLETSAGEESKPEPPPLPRRPSKTTSTPLPPDPALSSPRSRQINVQTALGSGTKPLSLDSPSNNSSGSGPPTSGFSPRATASSVLSRLGSSGQTRSATSSTTVLAPEHKAFLVDRLGYSPDRLIQLAPLGDTYQGTAGSKRLEKLRGALKRRQSAISNRAASALSLVLETFKSSFRTDFSTGGAGSGASNRHLALLPRAVLGSLSRHMKAPRILAVAVPSTLHWRRHPRSRAGLKKTKSSSTSSASSPTHASSTAASSSTTTLTKNSSSSTGLKKEPTTRVVFRKRGRGFSSAEHQTRRPAQDVFAAMAAAELEAIRQPLPEARSPRGASGASTEPVFSTSGGGGATKNRRFALKRPSDLNTAALNEDALVKPQDGLDEAKSGIRWSRLSHGQEWL